MCVRLWEPNRIQCGASSLKLRILLYVIQPLLFHSSTTSSIHYHAKTYSTCKYSNDRTPIELVERKSFSENGREMHRSQNILCCTFAGLETE